VDRWEPVDLKATLDEVVRLIAYDRRARNVRIDWAPTDADLELHGLRDQLQQVFINLALNALDAMPDGGELRIRAEKQGQSIVVRLADTGCGVPPELGRRIFDPFFTTKPQGQGTGLGLAVSYGVVQRHGGTIDFESNNGRGTVFTIELPIQATAADGRS
jgi:signal transduction histidine kinase